MVQSFLGLIILSIWRWTDVITSNLNTWSLRVDMTQLTEKQEISKPISSLFDLNWNTVSRVNQSNGLTYSGLFQDKLWLYISWNNIWNMPVCHISLPVQQQWKLSYVESLFCFSRKLQVRAEDTFVNLTVGFFFHLLHHGQRHILPKNGAQAVNAVCLPP